LKGGEQINMLKKLLKSALILGIAAMTGVGATGAYFTSNVTAANNVIVAGTLRLDIDSTRTHTAAPHVWNGATGPWGSPYDSYAVVRDVNGVNTQLSTLEPWLAAAPGPYAAYDTVANGGNGADVLADGNHSYWISFRNMGNITMKVKSSVTGGTWTVDPAVEAANPGVCTSANLNAGNVVTVPNVTFYGTTGGANICKGNEECENIYYGITSLGGWSYSTDPVIQGSDFNIAPSSSTVYVTDTGLSSGTPITLKSGEFVIARVDANFDTSNNCYQGATYNYNLNGSAYQVGDLSW
jgi:hypothetical protein